MREGLKQSPRRVDRKWAGDIVGLPGSTRGSISYEHMAKEGSALDHSSKGQNEIPGAYFIRQFSSP